ncbi:MAG: entericidin A/B family lipoprotein [Paracoccaceae bacterium]|jgi:entericidin B
MTRNSLIILALLALSACETIKGAGRDLQTAGATIEAEASTTP